MEGTEQEILNDERLEMNHDNQGKGIFSFSVFMACTFGDAWFGILRKAYDQRNRITSKPKTVATHSQRTNAKRLTSMDTTHINQ